MIFYDNYLNDENFVTATITKSKNGLIYTNITFKERNFSSIFSIKKNQYSSKLNHLLFAFPKKQSWHKKQKYESISHGFQMYMIRKKLIYNHFWIGKLLK